MLLAGQAAGGTWRVAKDGSGDFGTLAAACNSAAASDSILIAPGTYNELAGQITLTAKPLVIQGAGPDRNSVVLYLNLNVESSSGTVLSGVSVWDSPTPIYVRNSQFEIRNCEFRRNTEAAVVAINSEVLFEDCLFEDNYEGRLYDGAAIWGYDITARRCTFTNNRAPQYGGALYLAEEEFLIEDCVFIRNAAQRGAAIAIDLYPPSPGAHKAKSRRPGVIRNCTFYNNEVTHPSGLGAAVEQGGGWLMMYNTIIARTRNGWGAACPAIGELHCCVLWDNDMGNSVECGFFGSWGDLVADPMFCNPESGDL
jgi:hypothetical protein